MKIANVTPRTMSLLAKLKENGDLVDVYSKEFFKRHPEYATGGIENDLDGTKLRNHLLFISAYNLREELLDELLKVYPPLKKMFNSGGHDPDFLLLNLHTRQMLCVGFGRKNGLFIMDAATAKTVYAFDLIGPANAKDEEYMDKFEEHDYWDAVRDFLTALSDLGQAMYWHDDLPLGDDDIGGGLFSEIAWSAKDRRYYKEGHDKGYTEKEMKEFRKLLAQYRAEEDRTEKMIHVFFPQCEIGDLNTGDY